MKPGIRALGGSLVLLLGLGLGGLGLDLRSRAERELASEISVQLASLRESERVLRDVTSSTRAAGPRVAALRAGRADRDDPQLARLEECARAPRCDLGAELERLAAEDAGRIATALVRAEAQSARATGLLVAGLAVLALLGIAAVWPPAPPPAPAAPVEEVLSARLAELYQLKTRVSEIEHFAQYGELAAGLSHGLKTPLATMRAALQVAERKIDEAHPARAYLTQVIAEIDGLVEQVRRFLAAANPTSASRIETVGPSRLVQLLDDAYRADAARRGIVWTVEPGPDLDRIRVDTGLLEIALRNLVENALAATPSGKRVSVSAARAAAPDRAGLENQKVEGGAWIELRVEDEGGGIPQGVAGGVRGVSTKASGSGLGLAIARRIVERHGGALAFEPRDGGGTAVRVVLPVHATPGMESAP